MANISSYNQLSSWNEDDDLLFVQQPDAPKKAHPSQMKEYILRGLDVSSVGGTGKYISAISEADGKISATAETMDEVPTQDSNNPVKSGGIFSAIDDSVSLKTATGNPITLTDAANANAEELSMTIEPIQSGSGDPSPTNVRPISGLTSGEVQTTNGTDTNTATITFGQTVYGGSVNFKTGEVTVTHKSVTFVGSDSENWTLGGYAGNEIFIIDLVDIKQVQSITDIFTGKADKSKTVSFQELYDTPNVFCVAGSNNTNLYCKFGSNATIADVKAWLSTNHLQLCYELATPTTLTLTPAELELLKGNNTITANGAEISIEYYPDNAIGALAGRVDDLDNITSDMQEQIDEIIQSPSAIAFNQRVDRNWDGLGALVTNATDVTADFDAGTLSQKIAANNFDDYDLGMKIVKTINIDGANYTAHIIFAHANAFFGYNDYAMVDTPNIGCVVYVENYRSTWNASNTDGAYTSSQLRVAVQKVVTALKAVLGESHMIKHNVVLSNATTNGKSSSGAWTNDSFGEALSAAQVCGVNPSGSYFDIGEAYEKLALFDLVKPNQVFGYTWLWFRDVLTATYSAFLSDRGGLFGLSVNNVGAVISLIMLK